ncbi:hypothetical protein BN1723_020694, partial [Verticillium longisporum]
LPRPHPSLPRCRPRCSSARHSCTSTRRTGRPPWSCSTSRRRRPSG